MCVSNNVQDALVDSKWKQAMNEGMANHYKNGTWELTELYIVKRTIGVYSETQGK